MLATAAGFAGGLPTEARGAAYGSTALALGVGVDDTVGACEAAGAASTGFSAGAEEHAPRNRVDKMAAVVMIAFMVYLLSLEVGLALSQHHSTRLEDTVNRYTGKLCFFY